MKKSVFLKRTLTRIMAASLAACFCFAGCGGDGSGSSAAHKHSVSKKVAGTEATCLSDGVREHGYCDSCGALLVKVNGKFEEGTESDLVIEKADHDYSRKTEEDEYLLSEATAEMPERFAKACVWCGLKSKNEKDVFTVGKSLNEYAEEDKSGYEPHSVTLTLYDAANCVYGFCWNAKSKPARAVVEIKKSGIGEYTKVRARHEKLGTYEYGESSDKQVYVNYIKAEIALEPDTVYEYRVGDAYLGTFSPAATLKTVAPEADKNNKWGFAHVSDSQSIGEEGSGKDSGVCFADTLDGIARNESNRFVVHTGDVVEWSRYESYWDNMLGCNYARLSVMPVMAISGNHEADYRQGSVIRSGISETYKHFNYKIHEQNTQKGIYYSFSYGDVKFIMLNTNEITDEGMLKNDQYEWLCDELEKRTEKWTIVSMHNPMYSVGKWGSDEGKNNVAKKLTAQLGGVFAKHGVDLVLQGHDHMISRTRPISEGGVASEEKTENVGGVEYTINPKGTIYVMNGPAGSQDKGESAIFAHDEALYAYAESSYKSSWADVEIDGNTLTLTVKYMQSGNPTVLKTWGIKK